MADLRIVDAPVLLQESITDDVKMPTGGLGNFSIRLGDIVWHVVAKEQLASKNYVDLSSKGVKDSLDEHIADKANPHNVTKAQVGLGSVDNTADVDKPVSNAVRSAIITATTDMATKAYVSSKDGDLTTLTTSDKTTLVKAINEVNSNKDNKATTLSDYDIIDTYTKKETYNTIEIDNALSLKANTSYVDSKDGDLSTLTTSDKTTLVKAINEVNNNTKDTLTLLRSKKLIDTRLYGVVANTDADQTSAIHDAFADNPTSSSFYIPSGTINANIIYPRDTINLIGDSLTNTILEPFDKTKPVISFNKFLFPSVTQMTVQAGQDYTSEQLIDARDSRYITMQEVVCKKTIKDGEAHNYQTILIDNRCVNETWTGYNVFKTVRCVLGAYGYLADTDKLNSVINMTNCVFAYCGYFGIKTNTECSSFLSLEVAENGKLCPTGTYDETRYGGMYLEGHNSVVLGAWHEYNKSSTENFSDNNIYVTANSSNIVHNFGRNTRNLRGVRVLTQSQGQLINVSVADKAIDDGTGRARPQQLIKNGNFKHVDNSGNPKGWLNGYNATVTQETNDLPLGYATGIKVISKVPSVNVMQQIIFDSANVSGGIIKDISKWAGREITVSFWLKKIGTDSMSVRAGIVTLSDNFLGDGAAVYGTTVGKWEKFVCSYKVVGNEERLTVGIRFGGVGEGFITTGFSLADDCRVLDSQPKPITEDGGDVFGALTVNGTHVATRPTIVSSDDLLAVTGAINTTDKYAGKMVFNTSDLKVYYATGQSPTSRWQAMDSLTVINPV